MNIHKKQLMNYMKEQFVNPDDKKFNKIVLDAINKKKFDKAREERVYSFKERSLHHRAVKEFSKEVCSSCVNRMKCLSIRYKLQYKSISSRGRESKNWYSINKEDYWLYFSYRIGCRHYIKIKEST